MKQQKILLIQPGHGISTSDVWSGAGDALLTMGYNVTGYELKNRLRFYQEAVKGFIKGSQQKVAISDIYSVACQGLMTSIMKVWPDVIIYITGQYIPPWVPELIKLRFPHIKQVVWYTESPYMIAYEIQRAPLYDYVFTCDKVCENIYQRFNSNSYYLPTAFNSEYGWDRKGELSRWEKVIYTPDLFFVGSEVPGRLEFLKELVQHLSGKKIEFKLFGAFPSIDAGLCPELESFFVPTTLSKFEVIKYYRNSKITINQFRINESKSMALDPKTHQPIIGEDGKEIVRDIIPYSLSPRVYEIMAAGAFLLTDYRAEIDELFVPGEDLVVFQDVADCAEKIMEYLEKDKEREATARSGQRKVQEHTYINRMKKMMKIIGEDKSD